MPIVDDVFVKNFSQYQEYIEEGLCITISAAAKAVAMPNSCIRGLEDTQVREISWCMGNDPH